MEISILKNVRFLVMVVNRSIYMYIVRICKMLISCVKLDHALYSINYGMLCCLTSIGWCLGLYYGAVLTLTNWMVVHFIAHDMYLLVVAKQPKFL